MSVPDSSRCVANEWHIVCYVEASLGDRLRKTVVLRDGKGLTRDQLADAIQITVGNLVVHLLAPIKVLKAKMCNVVTLDQCCLNWCHSAK